MLPIDPVWNFVHMADLDVKLAIINGCVLDIGSTAACRSHLAYVGGYGGSHVGFRQCFACGFE